MNKGYNLASGHQTCQILVLLIFHCIKYNNNNIKILHTCFTWCSYLIHLVCHVHMKHHKGLTTRQLQWWLIICYYVLSIHKNGIELPQISFPSYIHGFYWFALFASFLSKTYHTKSWWCETFSCKLCRMTDIVNVKSDL